MYSDDSFAMPEDLEGVGDELWWDYNVDEELKLPPYLVSGSYFPQSQLCMTFRSKIYSL